LVTTLIIANVGMCAQYDGYLLSMMTVKVMYVAGVIGDLSDCTHCVSKPIHQVSMHCYIRRLTRAINSCRKAGFWSRLVTDMYFYHKGSSSQ